MDEEGFLDLGRIAVDEIAVKMLVDGLVEVGEVVDDGRVVRGLLDAGAFRKAAIFVVKCGAS